LGVKLPIWLLTLLLAITCVLSVQMSDANSFQISTLQDLFNDIMNISIQWVLTPAIALWRFGNPLGFELPKWELIWECEGSFPHILLHSQEHEMWLPGSLLARTLVNPCLGREPKARIATNALDQKFHLTNNYSIKPTIPRSKSTKSMVIVCQQFHQTNLINQQFH
jgi:hypothetical protein